MSNGISPRIFFALSVIEVHDGDTFRLMLDVGFEQAAFPWLRLRGFSCPELGTVKGEVARDETVKLLANVDYVVTKKRAGFEDMEKSFARYLADVYLKDGRSLGEVLVSKNLAVRGGRVG